MGMTRTIAENYESTIEKKTKKMKNKELITITVSRAQ